MITQATFRFLAAGFSAAALMHATASADIVRTPWGDPDLQGTYTSDNWIGVPMQRPPHFGTRALLSDEEYADRLGANEAQIELDLDEFPETEFSTDDPASINPPRHWLERPDLPARATSLIVDPADGRIPAMTPDGERRAEERRAARSGERPASFTDFSNYDRCLTRGLTGSIIPVIYGNGTQIVQAPGYIVLRHEMIHEARVIPLDGRPHVAGVSLWLGDSRGRWEGDTLVIETINFTDRTGIGPNGGGAVHSEELRLVERLTRTDEGTVLYQFTVHDPQTYTRPWTARFELAARPGYEIFEYACHEGNYAVPNMLSAARAEEAAAR